MVKKYMVLGLVALTLVAPVFAQAQGNNTVNNNLMQNLCNNRGLFDPGCVDLQEKSDLFALLFGFLWLIRTVFWILAVAMLLFAAYQYLIGGATGKVDKAKDLIKYAVIAMVIALVATSIPYLIKSIIE